MTGSANSTEEASTPPVQPAEMWVYGVVCVSGIVGSLVLVGLLGLAKLSFLAMLAYFAAPVAAICIAAWVFYDHHKRAMLVQEERRLIGYSFVALWATVGLYPLMRSLGNPTESIASATKSALVVAPIALVVSCVGVFVATRLFGKRYAVHAVA